MDEFSQYYDFLRALSNSQNPITQNSPNFRTQPHFENYPPVQAHLFTYPGVINVNDSERMPGQYVFFDEGLVLRDMER